MKYENFTKATELIKKIDNITETLQELAKDSVFIRVEYRKPPYGSYTIKEIEINEEPEHECKPIAEKFIQELTLFYTNKKAELLKELETL